MDKLTSTLITLDVLERTKTKIEEKCIALSEELDLNPSEALAEKLNYFLEKNAQVELQIKRFYKLQDGISLTDERGEQKT